MEEEQLSTIFDKYEQVGKKDPKRGKGTGLGLSIAKGIVAAHGGDLSVRSTPGRGTMFYFSLPKV
jgi:signal transduction histidine kinase